MARMYLFEAKSLTVLYATDQAVGTGGANRRDDVLLVQFFLKVASEGPQKDRYAVPGKPAITCDGIWGPNSQAYLNKFIAADSAANPNTPLTADGRVDPVVGGKIVGSISGNLYTIVALNDSYRRARNIAAHNDITKDAMFPAALKPSLKVA